MEATTGLAATLERVASQHDIALLPARVIHIDGRTALLKNAEWGAVEARLAMSGLRDPAPGDLVLAIGGERTCYVIGLLETVDTSWRLVIDGDFEIRAPRGGIDLFARDRVRIRSSRIGLQGLHVEISARSLLEKCGRATRWIREALQVRAGRMHTRVTAEYRLDADRIAEVATRDVRIDGDKINLG